MNLRNSHADFTLQVLLYLARLAAQNDLTTPGRIGLRPDQVEAIGTLNARQLHELALNTKTKWVDVKISEDVLDKALHQLKSRTQQRETVLAMVRGGASFSMMNALFGLSTTDHADFRKLIGLSNQGRPSMPCDDVQAQIWQCWTTNKAQTLAQRLLAIHDDTGVDLSAIWHLIQSWHAQMPESEEFIT